MNIKKSSGNISKKDLFNMIEGGSSNKMADSKGDIIEFDAWVQYETENAKGETVTALAILETNGLIHATISETFIKQFEKILDYMGEEKFAIRVIGGITKAGREYITCEIA